MNLDLARVAALILLRRSGWAVIVAIFVAVAAVATRGPDAYDLFHYYLVGKYGEELGTDGIYACALATEEPRFERVSEVRDLGTYEVLRREELILPHEMGEVAEGRRGNGPPSSPAAAAARVAEVGDRDVAAASPSAPPGQAAAVAHLPLAPHGVGEEASAAASPSAPPGQAAAVAHLPLAPHEMGEEEAPDCPARFSPARWAAFSADVAWLAQRLPAEEIPALFVDRGANPTPFWQATGGFLARHVPLDRVEVLLAVDPLLLAAATLLAARAFGLQPALATLAFVLTAFPSRWPVVGTSLLREDWLAASIAAVSLVRLGRPALGGAALAWAAASRVFPVLFGVGIGMRAGWRCLRREPVGTDGRFLIGFATASLLFGVIGVVSVGPDAALGLLDKLRVHAAAENVSAVRVGLPVALAWRGEHPDSASAVATLALFREQVAEQAPIATALAILALLGAAWASRRRELDDVAAWRLGLALVPLVLQLSVYYYAFLALIVLSEPRGSRIRLATIAVQVAAFLAIAVGVRQWTVLAAGSAVLAVGAVAAIVVSGRR